MAAPGIYQHHKGQFYRVLFTAMDSNNDRNHEVTVVYVSLNEPHSGQICVRHECEFTEHIKWPDGAIRPRFQWVRWET